MSAQPARKNDLLRLPSLPDCISQFAAAIAAAGQTAPSSIVANGVFQRYSTRGGDNSKTGWYVMHVDGIPSGAFGDWREGTSVRWRADIGRTLTGQEERDLSARMDAMRKAQEVEKAKKHSKAAQSAANQWARAQAATVSHPYLARKGVNPHGVRLLDGCLLVPVFIDGVLSSLQYIHPDGKKMFMSGGASAGGSFTMGETEGADALCIAEGFATGASVHEATGFPVVVAFNAGNLGRITKTIRARYPMVQIVICADDDEATAGNPGMTKAKAAASDTGALVAVPDFGSERPENVTDFNDMAALHGLEAVAAIVRAALSRSLPVTVEAAAAPVVADLERDDAAPEMRAATDIAADSDTESEPATKAQTAGVPSLEDRPQYVVFEDWLEADCGNMYKPGVWYFSVKFNGDAPPQLREDFICSPLHIDAITLDGQDNNYGRLLRFRNSSGRWRKWPMPMDMLRGSGEELRGELLAMGMTIDPRAHRQLSQYLQAREPKERIRCATQVGWCEDAYVLPDQVLGPGATSVIFQSGERGYDEHTRGGTLAGWRTEIAARAVGNPLLALALSASFAGPLLAKCNAESGGLHLVGDSSTGKTTAIEAACATWGGPNFRRSWRATANGMEGAASLFNDCLLALDEISECDPREVGAIVYALGNGRGKQRAGRSGNARGVTRWRCMVLSSGERTIATTMAEGGQRAKAGQAVRLLDVPALRRYGAWDDLQGMDSGPVFSDALKRACATHYGHAGRAFVERLSRDDEINIEMLEAIKSLPEFSPGDAEGQDRRASARFALIAWAGELASSYGVTGWPEGLAIASAANAFRAWRGQRGRGNDERRQILESLAAFIDRHGDGRFTNADQTQCPGVQNRAGWWRDDRENGRLYMFTTEAMREAVKGFDFKRALDTLQEAGALPAPSGDGERARSLRIGGRKCRLYIICFDKLGGRDEH